MEKTVSYSSLSYLYLIQLWFLLVPQALGLRSLHLPKLTMLLPEDTISQQNAEMEQQSRRRHVFLFTHPRTASNLLCRLLSDQPNWMQAEYHFRNAFTFARRSFNWGPVIDIDEEQRVTFANLLQDGYNELQQFRDATRLQVEALASHISS